MIRQSISRALLIVYITYVTLSGDDMEYNIHEAKRHYMLSQDYCTIEEFEEMDYYLFCGTQIHKSGTGSGFERKPSIIYNDTKTSLLTIRRVEDGTERWSYDLEGIREDVWERRDDMQKGYEFFSTVCQFEGNEQEGWLVMQAGSSFYKIAYPSGKVTYLGEYLYSPSFSPDGRYLAYSSVDYDNRAGMKSTEYEQSPPPGIYVRDIETGKTAYIYWDPSRNPKEDIFEYRDFLWIEKDSFEEYMTDTGN